MTLALAMYVRGLCQCSRRWCPAAAASASELHCVRYLTGFQSELPFCAATGCGVSVAMLLLCDLWYVCVHSGDQAAVLSLLLGMIDSAQEECKALIAECLGKLALLQPQQVKHCTQIHTHTHIHTHRLPQRKISARAYE